MSESGLWETTSSYHNGERHQMNSDRPFDNVDVDLAKHLFVWGIGTLLA